MSTTSPEVITDELTRASGGSATTAGWQREGRRVARCEVSGA